MINIFASATEATSTSAYSGYGVAWAVIIGGICYAQRRRAIGGWLLLYFIFLYLGLLFSLFMAITAFSSYDPASWPTPSRYLEFLLTTVPVDIGTVLLVILSFNMLSPSRRNWRTIQKVQILLATILCVSFITAIIDVIREETALFIFSAGGALSAGAWLAYFAKSRRVQSVYKTMSWASVPNNRPEVRQGVLESPQDSAREIEKDWKGVISSDSDLAAARLVVGNALLKKGSYEEASWEFLGVLGIHPDRADAHFGLALSKAYLGNKEECIESLRNAIEKGFDDWPTLDREQIFARFSNDPWFKILAEIIRKRWAESQSSKREPGALSN